MAITKLVSGSLGTGVGGSLVKLNSTTVSSPVAQVDFTNLSSDYNNFQIIISNLIQVTDAALLNARFFQSETIVSGASDYIYAYAFRTSSFGSNNSTGDSSMRINIGNGNVSGENTNTIVDLFDVHSTNNFKSIFSREVSYNPSGISSVIMTSGGLTANTNAIDGIRFFLSSGNISSGTFTLYGVNQ